MGGFLIMSRFPSYNSKKKKNKEKEKKLKNMLFKSF